MGHRLSKIYTRTGDAGTTGLGDGTRVKKHHARVEAYGTVDELNSALGLLLTHDLPPVVRTGLTRVQHELFDVGGELCIPGRRAIGDDHSARLEQLLDELNGELKPLKEFVLPGGTAAASVCHLTRAICRRAERRVVALAEDDDVGTATVKYLNRLSDLLFVVARYLNFKAGHDDVLWRPGGGK